MLYPKISPDCPLYNYFLNRLLSTGLYTTNTTLSNQAKLISKAATLQVKAYNAHRGYSFVPAEVIVDGNTPFRMDSIIHCFPDIFSLNANHISKKACKRYNIQFSPELELIAIQDSQEAIKAKLEAKNTTINNQLTKDIQVKPFPLKEENIFKCLEYSQDNQQALQRLEDVIEDIIYIKNIPVYHAQYKHSDKDVNKEGRVYASHQNLSKKQKSIMFEGFYNYDQKSSHPTLVSNISQEAKEAIISIKELASELLETGVINEGQFIEISKITIIKIIAGASVKSGDTFSIFKSLGKHLFDLVSPKLKMLKNAAKTLSKELGLAGNKLWQWLHKEEQKIQQIVINYCDSHNIFWLNEHDGIITNKPIDFSDWDLGVEYRLKPF